ncbi:MAG: hypothetical protein KatS3mg132_176 [Limisphaera sp.]|nr:MAG: hypothetical protein KatS3mg132_176 [Limisphaera sp.]
MNAESKCPFHQGAILDAPTVPAGMGPSIRDWWPHALPLEILHQHSEKSNPMGKDFDYRQEFQSLDYWALKKDLAELMTRVAGLVAGGLRPLRAVVHPHGLAQRRHLPHR